MVHCFYFIVNSDLEILKREKEYSAWSIGYGEILQFYSFG